MLKKEDLKQIHDKGISEEQISKQLEDFKRGFPYLKLEGAATPKKGITVLDKDACEDVCRAWKNIKQVGIRLLSSFQRLVQPAVCLRICLDSSMAVMMNQ